ncbi:MAG: GTP cyclohydrolase II, partial [Pseudomonadota bacterium]
PQVRERLIEQGSFRRIDSDGNSLSPDAPLPKNSVAINLLGPIPMPVNLPSSKLMVKWYAAVRSSELSTVESLAAEMRDGDSKHLFAHLVTSMAVNSVLVIGEPGDNPLVRVHSNCLTGDVFGSERCDCGPQLDAAVARINEDAQGGYIIYMAGHEGRGIGLWAKAATYLLQDAGQNTYQANRSLGLPDDSRDFSDAATLIKYFIGTKPFRLLSNNPKKLNDLHAHGLEHITPIKHVSSVGDWNRRYLKAKREWGHQLDDDDLAGGD